MSNCKHSIKIKNPLYTHRIFSEFTSRLTSLCTWIDILFIWEDNMEGEEIWDEE
jgi:hypothetical protein